MLRGVVFDFNGTLAQLAAWGRPHREVFAEHGLPGPGELWGEVWDTHPADGECHEEASRSEEAYRLWELDRLRARATRCGVPGPRMEALIADLHRESRVLIMRAYDDAGPALAALQELGLRLAVCSNWNWELDAAIAQSGLAGRFEVAVTSARAGMRKHDPRIYQATLAACGLAPEEALFVGDMWGPDVAGPRAIGMRAAHLWRASERAGETPPETVPGVWRVDGLKDVVALAAELTC